MTHSQKAVALGDRIEAAVCEIRKYRERKRQTERVQDAIVLELKKHRVFRHDDKLILEAIAKVCPAADDIELQVLDQIETWIETRGGSKGS